MELLAVLGRDVPANVVTRANTTTQGEAAEAVRRSMAFEVVNRGGRWTLREDARIADTFRDAGFVFASEPCSPVAVRTWLHTVQP